MKYLSLFSGIGAFEKALDRLRIPFELVGYCEIDKYAAKAYSLLHNVPESMNFGDITKLNEKELPDDIDLITYGFPCQDISLAGHQKGLLNEDGTKTRSGLFFDALRIIEHTQPKIAIAENVKNLTGTKFSEQFSIVLQGLADAGYNNYWKVLNAKDYEIPQNRERVLIVSIRKDIDTGVFDFPEPVILVDRLKNLLEKKVDEKYFVKDLKKIKALVRQLQNKDIPKLNTEIIFLGNVCPTKSRENPNQGRVYSPDGIAPCLNTVGGGNLEPMILIGSTQANAFVGDGSICCTLTEAMGKGGVKIPMISENVNPEHYEQKGIGMVLVDGIEIYFRIRKLTPKECFRLMGFDDTDVDLLSENGISNTQLYKMAGNSIVVNMLEFLFCQIFDNDNELWV